MLKQFCIAIGCCALVSLPATAQVASGSPSLKLSAQATPRSALDAEITQLLLQMSQAQAALNAAQADQAAAQAELKSPTAAARTKLNQRLQQDANLIKQETADITSANGWLSYWKAEKQTRQWNRDQDRVDVAVSRRQAAIQAQDQRNQAETAQGAIANSKMFESYGTEPLYDGWTSIPLPCN